MTRKPYEPLLLIVPLPWYCAAEPLTTSQSYDVALKSKPASLNCVLPAGAVWFFRYFASALNVPLPDGVSTQPPPVTKPPLLSTTTT